jgi:hypothetical protein
MRRFVTLSSTIMIGTPASEKSSSERRCAASGAALKRAVKWKQLPFVGITFDPNLSAH